MLPADTLRALRRSREFLADRFASEVLLAEAAAEAGYSAFHYQRLFQEAYGESPAEFVRKLRLERAERLLCQFGVSVSDACFEVGYRSVGTFSARFTREFGQPPSEYRRVFASPQIWALKAIPACFLAGLNR